MKRRDFLAASFLLGSASMFSTKAAGAKAAHAKQQLYELRKYLLLPGEKKNRFNKFLRQAAIPAWNRLGIEPVGVFSPQFGKDKLTLYVLLPHRNFDSVMTATERMLKDKEFLAAGADVLNAPLSDPAFVRMESSLLLAFEEMPGIEIPQNVKDKKSRIFELRRYESHSLKAAKKKIEMFNKGGEIAVFRKTGLHPVFFAETIIGPLMPNLTYMLAFEDMTERDKNWDIFRNHPDWLKLKADPQYKDTVSNITDIILRPASYSQI